MAACYAIGISRNIYNTLSTITGWTAISTSDKLDILLAYTPEMLKRTAKCWGFVYLFTTGHDLTIKRRFFKNPNSYRFLFSFIDNPYADETHHTISQLFLWGPQIATELDAIDDKLGFVVGAVLQYA
jgi:hypothetical protein